MKALLLITLITLVSCGKTTTEGCKETYDSYARSWSCTTSTSHGNVTSIKDDKDLTPEERCHPYMKNASNEYQDCLNGWKDKNHAMREWTRETSHVQR